MVHVSPGNLIPAALTAIKDGDFPARHICLPVCTAQGGGGSFKDRKPIGEVRCCESWMAEQTH